MTSEPGVVSPHLTIGRYHFMFRRSHGAPSQRFLGSAWRGSLGRSLKRAVCVTRLRACEPCLLYRSCAYAYAFETPPPLDSAKMRKYNAVPHPYVLVIPPTRDDRPEYELGLNLFGKGNQLLPYFIHALSVAGSAGVANGAYALVSVEQSLDASRRIEIYRPEGRLDPADATAPTIPPQPPAIRIVFETPFRAKRDGGLVDPGQFHFSDLFRALLRRISMLSYFHHNAAFQTDFKSLTAKAKEIEIEQSDLQWYDWTRYSSRQNTEMQMGGILGEFILSAHATAPFWPYLWLGQWTHAGKGTSMGLGRYTIEDAASLPQESDRIS